MVMVVIIVVMMIVMIVINAMFMVMMVMFVLVMMNFCGDGDSCYTVDWWNIHLVARKASFKNCKNMDAEDLKQKMRSYERSLNLT